MKVIQVTFDTILMTLILDDFNINEIYELVKKECSNFDIFLSGDKIFVKWSEDYIDECYVRDVTNERGIIQFESH